MRRISSFGYLLAFVLPVLVIYSMRLGDSYLLMPAAFVFIGFPILDYFVGTDTSNISSAFEAKYLNNIYYKLLLYTWALVQSMVFIYSCYYIHTHSLSGIAWIGMALNGMIISGGIGITVAHELGHKKNKFDRIISKILLMQVFYGHFYIEHNRGHHVNVSTPSDPSSAKKGQTFYAFLIQSIFGGIKSAWELEKQRLIIKKQAIFSWHNEALRLWFFSLLLFTSIVYISSNILGYFHYGLLIYLLAQSLLAIIVLEGANYIEHYGIQRKLLADGKYEKVNPTHSWNTNHIMSNFLLFQLQRHSDHHKTASKPYQLLSQYEDSPQLPNGYPAMFLLALIPTLWFKVMHPKLKNWEESIQKYASN